MFFSYICYFLIFFLFLLISQEEEEVVVTAVEITRMVRGEEEGGGEDMFSVLLPVLGRTLHLGALSLHERRRLASAAVVARLSCEASEMCLHVFQEEETSSPDRKRSKEKTGIYSFGRLLVFFICDDTNN